MDKNILISLVTTTGIFYFIWLINFVKESVKIEKINSSIFHSVVDFFENGHRVIDRNVMGEFRSFVISNFAQGKIKDKVLDFAVTCANSDRLIFNYQVELKIGSISSITLEVISYGPSWLLNIIEEHKNA